MCTYIYTSVFFFTDCPIYCILSKGGGVIKCHIFISVVVIELSVICLNTRSGNRLHIGVCFCLSA